jgi:hypothetical protein
MLFATIVSGVLPAVAFIVVAVALGAVIFWFWRRVVASSLAASAVVTAAFILLRTRLPTEFHSYAQDFLSEPLVRDFFRPPGESFLSVSFHFGLPCAILAIFPGLIRRRRDLPLTFRKNEDLS